MEEGGTLSPSSSPLHLLPRPAVPAPDQGRSGHFTSLGPKWPPESRRHRKCPERGTRQKWLKRLQR